MMKSPRLLSATVASAFVSVLALSACDRPTTVVTNPPGTTTEPAPPPVVVQQVPVPVPVPGPPGPQGETGKTGDSKVVILPPAASEPK